VTVCALSHPTGPVPATFFCIVMDDGRRAPVPVCTRHKADVLTLPGMDGETREYAVVETRPVADGCC
jgi:hypothetical protein